MYKIKLSEYMANQVEGTDDEFTTKEKAYIHGIGVYGSAGHNSMCGWFIEEVKKQESFGAWSDRNVANRTNK